jgi:hypothetical protein
MFHPVGNQNPSVYWRRRLFFAATVIAALALLAVTWHVLRSPEKKTPAADPSTSHASVPASSGGSRSTAGSTPASPGTTAGATSTPAGSAGPGKSGSATKSGASGSASTTLIAKPCVASQLAVSAMASKAVYTVGSQPVLTLQVIDKGTVPCVQNLADSQIVMRVYNGESRVWGSHDCEVEPGTDQRTLAVGQPVQISIVWSGLSSEAGCAGTRQRVGAGTYTLYVSLSGHDGQAAQFAMK